MCAGRRSTRCCSSSALNWLIIVGVLDYDGVAPNHGQASKQGILRTSVNLRRPIQANTPQLQTNLNEYGAMSKECLQNAAKAMRAFRDAGASV
jgi:hypothetical protein